VKHRWNNQILFIRKMAMQRGEEKIGIGGVQTTTICSFQRDKVCRALSQAMSSPTILDFSGHFETLNSDLVSVIETTAKLLKKDCLLLHHVVFEHLGGARVGDTGTCSWKAAPATRSPRQPEFWRPIIPSYR
jgi:hypothetical protein